jgi:site-specific recombinase XerD
LQQLTTVKVEMRALWKLQRESEPSPFVFVSERGASFSTAGFGRMVERAAVAPGVEIKAHVHMLRHACGYALIGAAASVCTTASVMSPASPIRAPRIVRARTAT